LSVREVLHLLLENGATTNSRDYGGFTPLHLLCLHMRSAFGRLDPNLPDYAEMIPTEYFEMIHDLLDYGADIDLTNYDPARPLEEISPLDLLKRLGLNEHVLKYGRQPRQ